MSESSGFFVSQGGDRKYTPAWLAKFIAALVTSGVYKDELAVKATAGMAVSVQSGRAWLEGYLYLNDSPLELPIRTADSVLHRRDCIVLRLNLTTRTAKLQLLEGTFGTKPVAPSIVRTASMFDLKLAELSVPAGTTSMTQALITDCRLDDAVCGITVSAVQHIPTASYLTQMETQFMLWFEQIKGILGEDEAGKLFLMISEHVAHLNNPHAVTAAQVGADPVGSAASAVTSHNTAANPHSEVMYTKTETIAAATKALFSLAATAVPDAVFAKIRTEIDNTNSTARQNKPVFGTYTGTGMSLTQDIYLGFSPSIVIVMAKGGTSNRARCQMASPTVDAEYVQLSGSKFTVKSDMNTSVSDYTNKNPFRYVAYR